MKRQIAVVGVLLCLLLPGAGVCRGEEEPAGRDRSTKPDEKKAGGAATLVESLQGESGVSVQTLCTNCNNADLSVAGFGGDYVEVVCDGFPMASGLSQVYLLTVMPPTVIDKVSVTKGAGEARLNGGAVGGAIEILTREPEPDLVLNASADAGGYGWSGARMDLSGREGWLGGSLVGSWARSDMVDANADANPDLPAFDRSTLEGHLDLKPGRDHRIRLGGTRYRERQEDGPAAFDAFNSTPAEPRYNVEDVDLEMDRFDGSYEGYLPGGSRLEVALDWSDRSQDIEETRFFTDPEPGPTYFIDDVRSQAAVAWSRPLGARALFKAGTSVERIEAEVVDVAYNVFQAQRLIAQGFLDPADLRGFVFSNSLGETRTERGGWAEGTIGLTGSLDLSLGARYVDFAYSDSGETREAWLAVPLPEGSRLLPRTALVWKPTAPLYFRFTAGAGYRAPEPIYEEVCCGRRYRNNRGVEMEESRSYGIEATYQPSPRFRVGGSVFHTDFDNLIVKMATFANLYRATYQHVNIPEAHFDSVSLETRWDASPRVSVSASVSWLDAVNENDGENVVALIDQSADPEPPPDPLVWNGVPYVAESSATIGVDLRPPRVLTGISVSAQYTGEMLIQRFDPTNSGRLEPRFHATEDFWVYNLRLTRDLARGLALFAGVDNIGDYVQADQGDPTTDYNWGPLRDRYVYGGVSYRFGD